ncbi:LysR family transcriptional regulator [Tardiphaga sp.]|jgi:DNA-binding transcriptional LysR family regulator|uniref:LysR family transcriptional regulator n=1 Tax=Tardiphaga sp. TaxID=1926292 RepID=UPI0037DA6250
MDWDDLRIFLQLSRAGQMTAAAKALAMDDSTVGRRVARLEGELGIQLVHRAGRRTILTEKGNELARAAGELESIVLRKVSSITDDSDVSGVVRIGAPEGFGVGFLAGRMASVASAIKPLEVELVALPRSYSLAAREVDIAITLERPQSGQLRVQKLTSYHLGLFGSDKYFCTHGRPDNLKGLEAHFFAGYISDLLFTPELNFLRVAPEIEMRPRFRSTSVIAQLEAIESGVVIGILPLFLAAGRPSLRQVMVDQVLIERCYWIAVHDDMKRRPAIRHLMHAIVSSVRSSRQEFLLS